MANANTARLLLGIVGALAITASLLLPLDLALENAGAPFGVEATAARASQAEAAAPSEVLGRAVGRRA